jgi:hypothetical protein
MGNKKNVRRRIPTAKKLAADFEPDEDSPPQTSTRSTRPKPRPTGKGATKVPQTVVPAEPAAGPDSDTSMLDGNDGEDNATEDFEGVFDNGPWDDEEDEDEDEEVEIVSKGKRKAAVAPLAGM